jgi:hypothetical protein
MKAARWRSRCATGSARPAATGFVLASRGANHVYMAYIGVGWAMARLPKLRWRAIEPHDPLLRWLALDGYGFHQAYFHTKQYVWQQHQAPIPGWEPAGYANRVVDQGIGRALWFVNGSDVQGAATTIEAFLPSRRADLWSGAALAANAAPWAACDRYGPASLTMSDSSPASAPPA